MTQHDDTPSARLKVLIDELNALDKRGVFDCCHRDVRADLRAIVMRMDEQAVRVADAEEDARPLSEREREIPRFDILRPRPSLRLVTPVPAHVYGRAAE